MTDDEPRYTLAEAAQVLAERNCAANGHEWTTIANAVGIPITMYCSQCNKHHATVVWKD